MLICQSLSAGLVAADRALNGCVRQVAAEHWLFRYPAQNSGLYRKTVLFHAVSALLPQCVVRTSMVHENPILVLLQGIPPPIPRVFSPMSRSLRAANVAMET